MRMPSPVLGTRAASLVPPTIVRKPVGALPLLRPVLWYRLVVRRQEVPPCTFRLTTLEIAETVLGAETFCGRWTGNGWFAHDD